MATKKVCKAMAQRFVVQVLNCNIPTLDAEEEGIDDDTLDTIMDEYKSIVERLRKIAVKNGGEFNQYSGG